MKKQSFINETGRLVMETPMPKTLVDIFNEVELIIEEKLDNVVNALQQQESLPEGMNIPGIDLTNDGRILTYEEQEKIETHVSMLYNQQQKIRHYLVDIDTVFIPKMVFINLGKELGLLMSYPFETKGMVYTIPQFTSDNSKLLKVPNDIRQAMVHLWNMVGTKKGFQICTLAYKKITNDDVPLGTFSNPVQLESNSHTFGLFVEYGEYVAIIPATFYNITDMEQQFINKALEVGEKWDACTYVYN